MRKNLNHMRLPESRYCGRVTRCGIFQVFRDTLWALRKKEGSDPIGTLHYPTCFSLFAPHVTMKLIPAI